MYDVILFGAQYAFRSLPKIGREGGFLKEKRRATYTPAAADTSKFDLLSFKYEMRPCKLAQAEFD